MDQELLGRRPASSRRGAKANGWHARLVVAVLTVVAVVCSAVPWALPGAPAPAEAAIPGSVTVLPNGFFPQKVNNQGWVAGQNGMPTLLTIWKPDGTLTEIVGSINRQVRDFTDDGKILTTFDGRLEIWDETGLLQTLPKPVVGDSERSVFAGYGPSPGGTSVGIFSWRTEVEANAARYFGGGAPEIITELSTVMGVATDGLMFGQLPGSTRAYGFVDGNQLVSANVGSYLFASDVGGDFHVVGSGPSGPVLYKDGAVQSVSPLISARYTNDQGAVVGQGYDAGGAQLTTWFRSPTGQAVRLEEITGNDIVRNYFSPSDMNDQCQVLVQVGLQPSGLRYVLVDIPNCGVQRFDAELEITDGSPVVDREMELTLTLRSEAAEPVADLALIAEGVGLAFDPEELEVVSGPEPEAPESLSGNGSVQLTYRVIPKVEGEVSVSAGATGTRGGTPIAAETTLVLDVEKQPIGGRFFRTDNQGDYVKVGDPAPVRLRVQNDSGVELSEVRLVDVSVEAEGEAEATIERRSGSVPSVLGATGPASLAFVDYELTGVERGAVELIAEVEAVDPQGEPVSGTIVTPFEVRQDRLRINLELDPPEAEFPDDEDEPEPIEITSTVSFTNTSTKTLRNIRLQSLDVDRVFPGQELYVTFKEGINPDPIDPAILVPELPPGETSEEFTAIWEATDDGEVTFSAFATSVDEDGEAANGTVEKPWKAKPTKYLEITTEVVNPPSGELLEAGTQIIVNGTLENLSNTATLKVGPVYPFLEGNTGTMTLAYGEGAQAPNPTSPVAVGELELEPSASTDFQVRITTNASDPRLAGAQPSGGTRATLRWEPWAIATELDGEELLVRTYEDAEPGQEPDAQVKATVADLERIVSIDDSIEIPAGNKAAVVAAFLGGTVQGLYNAAIAAIYSIPDLIKMPYTVLRAAYEYQAKVWESFTEEEKDLFLTETSFLIVSVLQRNVELGIQDAGELYDQVYEYTGQMLTETQNEWQTGDFVSTSQKYSAFLSETIGSVAGPMVLTKLAQTPRAAAAIQRAQAAIQARMAPTLAAARQINQLDGVLPLLRALENGTELQLDEIAKLYGLSADEVALFQQIANEFGFLLTIRSRHPSSIEWIQRFGAMLKPEAIKVKTVSELDVALGYRADDLGSVIFRKPEVLKTLPDGGDVDAAILQYVQGRGFQPGTKKHTEAVERVKLRIKEWNKHELEYKRYDEQGWVKTPFDYEGNAISDQRTGAQRGKYTGFRLRETSPGSEEYVVELLNAKAGQFRRVTGDIDPIAFTYTDGLPLSEADHRKLIQRLMNSPVGAEHGESATFTRGGVQFISSQFKPDEPGLQFAPDALAPRVVRLDPERSRWNDPFDYNLHWEGGFIDSGTTPERALPAPYDPNFGVIVPEPAPPGAPAALPAAAPEPTVGRCVVTFSAGTPGEVGAGRGATGAYLAADGFITAVDPEGNEARSELHDTCFAEGPPTPVTVAPTNVLAEPTTPVRRIQASPVAMANGAGARSIAAGTSVLELLADPAFSATGADGFVPGQQLLVGAGTDRAEIVTVGLAAGTRIVLAEPLVRSHEPGEVVVMVRASDGTPVPPVPPTPQPPAPQPPAPSGPEGEGSGPDGTAPPVDRGSLARTGSDARPLVLVGVAALMVGAAVLLSRSTSRRRPGVEP